MGALETSRGETPDPGRDDEIFLPGTAIDESEINPLGGRESLQPETVSKIHELIENMMAEHPGAVRTEYGYKLNCPNLQIGNGRSGQMMLKTFESDKLDQDNPYPAEFAGGVAYNHRHLVLTTDKSIVELKHDGQSTFNIGIISQTEAEWLEGFLRNRFNELTRDYQNQPTA